jgi:hypothetical protein
MKTNLVTLLPGVFLLACGGESETDPIELDERQALMEASAVHVADLTDAEEGTSVAKRLRGADFQQADESDARSITRLLGSDESYMDTDNACFNHDVAIRFDFPDEQSLDAVVGLTCWNVDFVSDEDQATPPDGYLMPGKLEELAGVLHHVVPSLNVEGVGE